MPSDPPEPRPETGLCACGATFPIGTHGPVRTTCKKCHQAAYERKLAQRKQFSDAARAVLKPKPEPESNDLGRKGGARRNVLTSEVDYTADEVEFALAMDRYKRENSRPFPTWSEALAVLRALGYRRTAALDPPAGGA